MGLPEYYSWGDELTGLDPNVLISSVARQVAAACAAHPDFEILEFRRRVDAADGPHDVVVVDCANALVPSRNLVGIEVRERLALEFGHADDRVPMVRALRKDFPVVLHLNHVLPEEPASLCLYFESWAEVERTWTPQKHLQRIEWWLSETARGTLHRGNQPLEQVYLQPPFELVLPADFDEKCKDTSLSLAIDYVSPKDHRPGLMKAWFQPAGAHLPYINYFPLLVTVDPVVQGPIHEIAGTLGALHDQLASRNAPLIESLTAEVKRRASGGVKLRPEERCLLLIATPVTRTPGGPVEQLDVLAFVIGAPFGQLGLGMAVLHRTAPESSQLHVFQALGPDPEETDEAWREFAIVPIGIRGGLTKKAARQASGVNSATAEFNGVLAGVGALGGTLADLWSREAWGSWALADPDIVYPHNVVRHSARYDAIGKYKVDVVKRQLTALREDVEVKGVPKGVLDGSSAELETWLAAADLVVDASTTLTVPRELSRRVIGGRAASVFLTPSGMASVLLLESKDRSLRLDALEPQYYRAVLESGWGAKHLVMGGGDLWVGSGCRDISALMSHELITLHAATLARQLRKLHDEPQAEIRVWALDDAVGALSAHVVAVAAPRRDRRSEWEIVWDEGINAKLASMRNAALPNETGGAILGYIDQKLQAIYVVDVLPAPMDSQGDPTGFVRGIDGLVERVADVGRQTRQIVTYVGEWHSHPPFTPPTPSSLDRRLIAKLSEGLRVDGHPALMMIVGSGDEVSISVDVGA